jgi:hypothetical protein
MKGFAISLDALVAITFMLFVMMMVATQTYQPTGSGGIYLKQLTQDATTVAEKTGAFDRALTGNTSSMQRIIESTPKLACLGFTIKDKAGNVIISAVKSDCNETIGLDVQTTVRPVLYQGSMYVIKTDSWFRKEPV